MVYCHLHHCYSEKENIVATFYGITDDYNNLFAMIKEKINIYADVLGRILEDFGLSEEALFRSNEADCVQARQALVVVLSKKGLSDKDIAELTHKLRRCSVCLIRNRYREENAPWTVRRCIDALKDKGCGH